jgi:hypothetical protein
MKLWKKHSEEIGLPALQVPGFGEFSLEEQPGGTLKGGRPLGGKKFESVFMFYEKIPLLEPGKIHFKLHQTDFGDPPYLDKLHVTFTYNRKSERWVFDDWDGTIGKNIAPLQWEKMLNDFLENKHAKKWLEGEETFGPPKKSIFQRLGLD